MLVVYGIKNCDSVKKALKFFNAHNITYSFVDFDQYSPSHEKINDWVQKGDINTLFNSKSTTYRTLGLSGENLGNNDKIQWMVKENRLIKRPVIEYDSQVIIGFNISQYEGIFLS